MADLPKYLYKYRTWSNPLHRRIITHNEIYFASPRSFNDPFDCRIDWRYELLTEGEFYLTQLEIFAKNNPKLETGELTALAQENTDLFFSLSEDELNAHRLRRQKVFDAETAIFTAASIPDDILMWSHYSESHKGFCVELEHKLLVDLVNKEPLRCKSPILPYKVDYPVDDSYPKLIPLPGLDYPAWIKAFTTKSKRWDYESEYRLIGFGATDFTVNINSGMLTRVLIGCQMSDSDQGEILHELLKRGDHVPVERAFKSKNKFALEFEPVDY